MNGYIIIIGCRKCGKCDGVCQTRALERIDGIVKINHEKCNLCMHCVNICPNKALMFIE